MNAMMEVLRESVAPVNLPFTLLLGLVVGYWLLVALGLVDLDDVGPEVGIDAGLEGGDAGVEHAGAFSSLLHFINIGEVPAMIVVSVLTLSAWTISLIANHYFNTGSLVLAAAFLMPNLLVSIIVTRYATKPFKAFFKALNSDHDAPKPVVGSTCTVVTSEANEHFGQAEIATKGAPLLIHVRTADNTVLKKGETGLVIRADNEKNIYTIIKVTPEKLEA